MQFRTAISITPQSTNLIDYQSKILLLGSCFSENIGKQLAYYKFTTLVNPFGTLFHPLAIAKVVEASLLQQSPTKVPLVNHQSVWHSWLHHSKLSALHEEQVIANIQQAQVQTFQFLKEATHCVITLGTSWAYWHQQLALYVANCHKMPAATFSKKMLSFQEMYEAMAGMIQSIQAINPSITFVFTLSPVRHTKDGLIENNLSKATLLTVIHQIINNFKGCTTYFPSYEMMMDDLRDYRFYEGDMVHPNTQAIMYIWEHFKDCWISKTSTLHFKTIHKIQQSLLHKPFNEHSEAHQLFLEKLADQITTLQKQLNISF